MTIEQRLEKIESAIDNLALAIDSLREMMANIGASLYDDLLEEDE